MSGRRATSASLEMRDRDASATGCWRRSTSCRGAAPADRRHVHARGAEPRVRGRRAVDARGRRRARAGAGLAAHAVARRGRRLPRLRARRRRLRAVSAYRPAELRGRRRRRNPLWRWLLVLGGALLLLAVGDLDRARARRRSVSGRHPHDRPHARAAAARAGGDDGHGHRRRRADAALRRFRKVQVWEVSVPDGVRGLESRPTRRRRRTPEWLTLGQAAKYLGVAQSTMRKWSDVGRVSAFYTPGGHRRYRRADLDQFLERSGRTPTPTVSGPLVLIVDDDERLREFVRVNLEVEGYNVREAGSAEEGLAALETEPPDLILLDVMMPKVDGWEMLQRVQERHGVGAIPVIMFSGKVDEHVGGRGGLARRAGVHRQAVRPALADRVDEATAAGLTASRVAGVDTDHPALRRRAPRRRPRSGLRGAVPGRLVRDRLARRSRSCSPGSRGGGRGSCCGSRVAILLAEMVSGAAEGRARSATGRRSRIPIRSRSCTCRRRISFPSGHATVSFACATVLALAVPRLRRGRSSCWPP